MAKLRRPTVDAPLNQPGFDAKYEDTADAIGSPGEVMADSPTALPEVADLAGDPPNDGLTVRPESQDMVQLADDAPAEVGDARADEDTADTGEDRMDVPPDTGGTDGGGAGGAGTGGMGTGGAGTGGMGTGGAGTGGIGTGGKGTGGSGGASTGGTGGQGGMDGGGGAGIDPDLVLWYKFDESSGKIAADSSGRGTGQDATLDLSGSSGTAAFSTDSRVGARALSLAPSSYGSSYGGGYLTVPAIQPMAPDALTIAVWVKLAGSTGQQWERVFDFGEGQTSAGGYLCMTSRMAGAAAGSPVRFVISKVGRPTSGSNPSEERLETTTTLTTNVWHHLALVLPMPSSPGLPYTGLIYIDGEVAASNSAMTVHLSDMAVTANNWLGRSQFENDPFFYGTMDDFRVYRRALSQAEIVALMGVR